MKQILEIWGNGKDVAIKYAEDGLIKWTASSWEKVVWDPAPQKSLIKNGYRMIGIEVLNGKKK